MTEAHALAVELVAVLTQAGRTLAVAESLTGGALASCLVAVPGASQVFRGGAVTYATDSKADVLGVDPQRLATHGAVDPEVARQMADGARRLFRSDVGVATTGVAGPSEQDGHPVGEVFLAVTWQGKGEEEGEEDRSSVVEYRFAGGRQQIREQSVVAALRAAIAVVTVSGRRERPGGSQARTGTMTSALGVDTTRDENEVGT